MRKVAYAYAAIVLCAIPAAFTLFPKSEQRTQAQPTPEKTVATGTIRFPLLPVQPEPIPPPQPLATTPRLTLEYVYVVDADVPILLLASPRGLVDVVESAGPLKIRAKFVDGNGKVESKNFKGKQIFEITALKTGTVEIIVVPVGASADKDVLRKTIDVDAGEGPRPPPIDPIDSFAKSLQIAFASDGSPKAQASQLASLYKLSGSIVDDPENTTPAAVFMKMHDSAVLLLKEPDPKKVTVLPNVRRAIAAELDKFLPLGATSTQPLNVAMRATIAVQFARVQAALETLK